MMKQIRLLPLVAFSALCLFGLKAVDIWLNSSGKMTDQSSALADQIITGSTSTGLGAQNQSAQNQAQNTQNTQNKSRSMEKALDKTFFEQDGQPEQQNGEALEKSMVAGEKKADQAPGGSQDLPISRNIIDFLSTGAVDEKKDQGAQDQGQPSQQQAEQGKPGQQNANGKGNANELNMGPQTETTKSEFAVLQSLAERRKKIEAQERQVELQKNLLQAAERKVESRIEELKALEMRVQAALKKQEEGESAQYGKLVQMYTNMKPADAAKIFNRLETNILLGLVQQIKPKTMSAIMAAMDPAQVERLTLEMANQSKSASLGKETLPKINSSEAN